MRLEGKTAIITGGATGIGFACAQAFIKEGAQVIIFGRRQDRLNQALLNLGPNTKIIKGDITESSDTESLVSQTLSQSGQIDILVNNAGTFLMAPLHEMDDATWDNVLNINLRGVFQLTREVLSQMIKQKSGSIINVSSILSLVGTPMASAYNTSKAALNQFSRSIAVEYGPFGIRSNTICPGMIETEMTEELRQNQELMDQWIKGYPLGRFGKPEEVANLCLFLASDESSFITGTIIPIDGGYTSL